jgi:hypothetical protein
MLVSGMAFVGSPKICALDRWESNKDENHWYTRCRPDVHWLEGLKLGWLAAIRDGLKEARAPRINDTEFEMVGYGSVFRPSETRGPGVPRIDPEALEDWEQQMLIEWWREAARLSASAVDPDRDEAKTIQGPDFTGRARTPAVVQRALRQLSKSRYFEAMGAERVLLFGLRQVRLFLHDADFKQLILARVAELVSPNTRVVVAHSLGSIVAYEALCLCVNWKIHTLVTIGSPLGIRHLVFDVLTPKPVEGRGTWPRVQRWVNIADRGDIVALEKALAPRFGPVENILVYNGWKSHDATRYLNTREVGAAVAAALT